MKRFTAILLTGIMIFSLASCGKKTQEAKDTAAEKVEAHTQATEQKQSHRKLRPRQLKQNSPKPRLLRLRQQSHNSRKIRLITVHSSQTISTRTRRHTRMENQYH